MVPILGALAVALILYALSGKKTTEVSKSTLIITPSKPKKELVLTPPFKGVSNAAWKKFVNVFLRLWTLKQNWEPGIKILTEIGITASEFNSDKKRKKESRTYQMKAMKLMSRLFYMGLTKRPKLSKIIGTYKGQTKITLSGMLGVIYSQGFAGAEDIYLEGKIPLDRTKVLFKITNGLF